MSEKMVEVERSFKEGDLIIKEGAPGSDMFIITEGKVAVSRDVNGEDVVFATLDRGDFFGEMSLLEGMPRSASVRALTDTTLLVLRPGGLQLKIRRDPTLALEMLQRMSSKLRNTSEQLTDLLKQQHVPAETIQSAIATSDYGSREE